MLLVMSLSIAFCSALSVYIQSSSIAATENRKNLYGEWNSAYYNISETDKNSLFSNNSTCGIAEVKGRMLAEDTSIAGVLGSLDKDYIASGRLEVLSGSLPKTANEIALTTTVLNHLGLTYDIGQTVDLQCISNQADLTDLSSANIQTVSLVLSGVLPAYDTYWKTEGFTPVDGIVTGDFYLTDSISIYQVLSTDTSETASDKVFSVGNENALVINDYAYPADDDTNSTMKLVRMLAVLFSCAVILTLLGSIMSKRRDSLQTFIWLGAPRRYLKTMLMMEGILFIIASTILGIFAGLGIGYLGVFAFGMQKYFSVSWGGILSAVLILDAGCIIAWLAVSSVWKNTQGKKKWERKRHHHFTLATSVLSKDLVLCILCFVIAACCFTAAEWQVFGYTINRDSAAVTIVNQSVSDMNEQMVKALESLPAVKEVSAMNSGLNGRMLSVTSEKIRNNEDLKLLQSDNDCSGMIMMYGDGVVAMDAVALQDKDLEALNTYLGCSKKQLQEVEHGTGVYYYSYQIQKDQNDDYSEITASESGNPLSFGIESGEKITVSYSAYSQEPQDYTVSNLFDQDITVEAVTSLNGNKQLFGKNAVFSGNTLIMSFEMYQKIASVIATVFPSNTAASTYNVINVDLEGTSSYATRKSIAAIVPSYGGTVVKDGYDIVDQVYTEHSQNAFMLYILGFLSTVICLVILKGIFSAEIRREQKRIGILQSLGASGRKMQQAYLKRVLIITLTAVAAALLPVMAAVWWINYNHLGVYLLKTYTAGADITFHYPWLKLALILLLLILVLIPEYLLELHRLIRNEPAENCRGEE